MVIPDPVGGTFSVKQILNFTYSYAPNRYSKRVADLPLIKHFEINELHEIDPQNPSGPPQKKYQIISYLKPKYRIKKVKGMFKLYNRRVTESYQIIFETDKLNINTKHWRIRLGTGNQWRKAPKKQILSVSIKDRKNLGDKLQEVQDQKYARTSMFVDEGDWNSSVMGINADFLFRCSFVYHKFGHLYGHMIGISSTNAPIKTNPKQVMFFPKHLLNFFDVLLRKGILIDEDQPKRK